MIVPLIYALSAVAFVVWSVFVIAVNTADHRREKRLDEQRMRDYELRRLERELLVGPEAVMEDTVGFVEDLQRRIDDAWVDLWKDNRELCKKRLRAAGLPESWAHAIQAGRHENALIRSQGVPAGSITMAASVSNFDLWDHGMLGATMSRATMYTPTGFCASCGGPLDVVQVKLNDDSLQVCTRCQWRTRARMTPFSRPEMDRQEY
jgi:hypothetical protein